MADLIRNRPAVFADSVSILAALLKPDRCKLFLDWLCIHSGQIIKVSGLNQIHDSLVIWFESLSETDALREYELVIREIGWWRDLKEEAMERMVLNEQEAG